MIFRNGRVVFPNEIRDDVDVVVAEGKIAELRPSRSDAAVVDLHGAYLAPGFVDLHVHGALGCDAMDAAADSFAAICHHHARGGTTSLLLTTATARLERIVATINAVRKGALPQIAGVHVEGPFISRDKAGAQDARFIREPDRETVARLLEHRDVIKRMTIAPEINGAPEAMAAFATARINVSGGHSDAWDDEARAGCAAGMRSVTHTFNCMSMARRRGIHRVAGLLEFALSEPEISCELIADGQHVSQTLMRLLYRAKGANGIVLVTDATAGCGLPAGAQFRLGGRGCVVRNGAAVLEDGSALAGSVASMIDVVRTTVKHVGVPLHEAVAMASCNPARQINLAGKGEIAVGNDADLLVLSRDLRVERVFVGGRELKFEEEAGHFERGGGPADAGNIG